VEDALLAAIPGKIDSFQRGRHPRWKLGCTAPRIGR